MGTVTKSIGTSARDYSTLQAWEDALPANLVTDGNAQVGECYNDSEFTTSTATLLTIAGETTDTTNFITIKCAAGQSFRDNASVQTNALRYNQSNGVGLRATGNFTYLDPFGISAQADNTVIDGLQFKNDEGQQTNKHAVKLSATNCTLKNSIVQMDHGIATARPVRMGTNLGTSACKVLNCAIMMDDGASMVAAIEIDNDGLHQVVNCTIARYSDATNPGTRIALQTQSGGHYAGANISINNAIFGFATFTDDTSAGQWGAPSGNNCTDLTSATVPGSANQVSKTYANQFQDTTKTTPDFRAKTGADLLNNGQTASTYITDSKDIAKTTRPQGLAWDIGAWELIPAAAATVLYNLINVM